MTPRYCGGSSTYTSITSHVGCGVNEWCATTLRQNTCGDMRRPLPASNVHSHYAFLSSEPRLAVTWKIRAFDSKRFWTCTMEYIIFLLTLLLNHILLIPAIPIQPQAPENETSSNLIIPAKYVQFRWLQRQQIRRYINNPIIASISPSPHHPQAST